MTKGATVSEKIRDCIFAIVFKRENFPDLKLVYVIIPVSVFTTFWMKYIQVIKQIACLLQYIPINTLITLSKQDEVDLFYHYSVIVAHHCCHSSSSPQTVVHTMPLKCLTLTSPHHKKVPSVENCWTWYLEIDWNFLTNTSYILKRISWPWKIIFINFLSSLKSLLIFMLRSERKKDKQ